MKLKTLTYLVFITAFVLNVSSAFANKIPEALKLNSLNEQWLVFDQETQNYVPYLAQIHQAERRIYLLIQPNNYKNCFLAVSSQKKGNLFIENAFWNVLEAQKWQTFDMNTFIDSLNRDKKILFTLYYPDKDSQIHHPQAWITKAQEWQNTKVEEKKQSILSPIFRMDTSPQTQLILLSFFTFFLVVLINQLVKVFDLKNILSFWLNSSSRNKEQINRIGIMEVVTFTVYQVLCLSFTLLVFGKYSSLFSYQKMFVLSSSWQGLLEAWLLFSLFIILLEVVYFLILSTLGNLYFNKKPTSQLHFSLYIQISKPFYTLFLLTSVLVNLSIHQMGTYWVDFIFILLLILYAFRALLISFELNKLVSFRKMYIIFYLCATEFTPLFFVVNVLL